MAAAAARCRRCRQPAACGMGGCHTLKAKLNSVLLVSTGCGIILIGQVNSSSGCGCSRPNLPAWLAHLPLSPPCRTSSSLKPCMLQAEEQTNHETCCLTYCHRAASPHAVMTARGVPCQGTTPCALAVACLSLSASTATSELYSLCSNVLGGAHRARQAAALCSSVSDGQSCADHRCVDILRALQIQMASWLAAGLVCLPCAATAAAAAYACSPAWPPV